MFQRNFLSASLVLSTLFCISLTNYAYATAGFVCGAPPLKKSDEGKDLEVNFWVLNASGNPLTVVDVQYAIDELVKKNRSFFAVRKPQVHYFETESDLLQEINKQSAANYDSWGTVTVLGDASSEVKVVGQVKNYSVVSAPDWRKRSRNFAEVFPSKTEESYYTVAVGHAFQMVMMGQSDRNLQVPTVVTDQHILAGFN